MTLAGDYPDRCGPDGIVFSAAPDGSAWAATGRNGAACSPPLGLLYRYGPPGKISTGPRSLPGGLLSRTGDGGRHWTELRPALAPTGLLDVVSPGNADVKRGKTAGQKPSGQ